MRESNSNLVEEPTVPVVLIIAGHDPSGGAGIQADIEAVVSQGVHAATAITALTVQDTHNVHSFQAMEPAFVVEQARVVLEDMPVAAIKIGMLANVEMVHAVAALLRQYPRIPVVLDPVLVAGGGGSLGDNRVAQAMIDALIPIATILTPNAHESRMLAGGVKDAAERGQVLAALGSDFVLMKGGDEPGGEVINWLYGVNPPRRFVFDRIEGRFHGSGCTLAAAIAGLLAQGSDPVNAVHEAQVYTHQTLLYAAAIGHGQLIPHRLFWADAQPDEEPLSEASNGENRIH